MNQEPVLYQDYGPIISTAGRRRLTGKWFDRNTGEQEVARPPHLDIMVVSGEGYPSKGFFLPTGIPIFLTPDGNITVSGFVTFEPATGELERVGIS